MRWAWYKDRAFLNFHECDGIAHLRPSVLGIFAKVFGVATEVAKSNKMCALKILISN